MRFYETMFILKPTLTQEEIDAKIEFIKNILINNNATIEGCINMGMRNLAYEIKKNKRGYYYVIYFKSEPNLITELERNYRISEDVIRFIIINYKNKTEQKTWQTLVDKSNGKIPPVPHKKKAIIDKENNDNISIRQETEDTQNIEIKE
ncbi:30S ribosomal protein S6 [Helicobacter sp. MIT 14-3879]|uniref:30S ribosomal protein S6 n=1 Tax=Helicobacter sp. MIT 14-3879 TaxID=2040649 RepID=UPI000E1F146C|nr:30S ribosomal protein S6 [Helicobacter sp. MIT 14-3879]RDU65114.1 30S ribosomal protein S6 [Helicobacter sp. MIT 14-3879]